MDLEIHDEKVKIITSDNKKFTLNEKILKFSTFL